jgi:hypothetical protein
MGIVAQACNPRYLGSEVPEDHGLRPALVKNSQDPHLNLQLGTVAYACHPSYSRQHE